MPPRLRLNRFDRNAIFALIIIVLVASALLVMQQIGASADFSIRIGQAYDMTQGVTDNLLINTPYYSVLIYLVYSLLPALGWVIATVTVSVAFYIATAVVVVRVLAGALVTRSRRTAWVIAGLTLVLLVIQPISLSPLISTRDMLFEWIMLSPHYNPTTMAARVFVLPLTLIAVGVFGRQTVFSWKQVMGVMLMVIVSTLIKPNWLIAFVPVFGVTVLIAGIRRVTLDKGMILIGFGLASAIALGGTFLIGFVAADSSSIVLGFPAYPLTLTVLAKLLLSLAFPLYVSLVWHRQARQDTALLLAWGILAAAIAQGLLFVETGAREGHGNFLWGQAIAGWVVFVLAIRLYVRQTFTGDTALVSRLWTWRIATLLLTLHALTGLLWWIAHYGTKSVLHP